MKVWKCDLDRGKEPIQSHLSWKIGLLHIFFIILMNPANKYLYTGEVRKKSKVGIFFLFTKECENLTLGEHLLLGCYLKHEVGYTQFFLKKSHCDNIILQNDFHEFKFNFFWKNHQWTSLILSNFTFAFQFFSVMICCRCNACAFLLD